MSFVNPTPDSELDAERAERRKAGGCKPDAPVTSKNKLDPVGTLEDVRRRVEEYEARVTSGDVEHNSLSRDRAFLLSCLPVETTDRIDEGKLRSFLRTVLAQGGDIWIDHRDSSTELYSARMDAAARERLTALLVLIGSSEEPSPEPCKHGHTNQGCRECFPLKATAPLKCKCGRDLVPYAGCPVCDVPAQNGKR